MCTKNYHCAEDSLSLSLSLYRSLIFWHNHLPRLTLTVGALSHVGHFAHCEFRLGGHLARNLAAGAMPNLALVSTSLKETQNRNTIHFYVFLGSADGRAEITYSAEAKLVLWVVSESVCLVEAFHLMRNELRTEWHD